MPRAGLSAERVVDEAERLADEVGLAQLSLAALAARLGVQPPSLYKHIAGQDALQRTIEARAKAELAEVMRDAAVGRSGADAVRSIAAEYRRWAKAHPGRYAATLAAPDPADADALAASVRAVDVLRDALAAYGLEGDDEIDAIRTLRSGLHGFVALEAAGGFGLPLDVDRSYVRLVDALVATLPSGR
ncbi:MAG TPA: TetR-like C-terminal domain-containing protein [Rhodoglobus sp.]|nr:TetR-like C-terminal domain-containing protein [Rhodoglobus sp.]